MTWGACLISTQDPRTPEVSSSINVQSSPALSPSQRLTQIHWVPTANPDPGPPFQTLATLGICGNLVDTIQCAEMSSKVSSRDCEPKVYVISELSP
jgi:hypothetical protein